MGQMLDKVLVGSFSRYTYCYCLVRSGGWKAKCLTSVKYGNATPTRTRHMLGVP